MKLFHCRLPIVLVVLLLAGSVIKLRCYWPKAAVVGNVGLGAKKCQLSTVGLVTKSPMC